MGYRKFINKDTMKFNEVSGDLIKLALKGEFDVIVHGCNCFCHMGAGLAVPMAKTFGCDTYKLEHSKYQGDINKLGQIDYEIFTVTDDEKELYVVNAYTQYHYGTKFGIPVDYEAITLCMRKMNLIFKGKHIGVPLLGAGLAGGDFSIIKEIMIKELKDCDLTIVHFQP